MTDLAALVVRMQADNSQYVKALEQASAKLEKFEKEQENALSQIKEQFSEMGKGIAAAFTIDKLIEFTSEAIESAASLDKLSQASGIGVEALGGLRLAAAASGISQEELGTVLKKLNVNISEAAGNIHSKAAVAFKALGISVTDASGKLKTAKELMPEIADAIAAMADGPNKTAFAIELLGKQGQNMIPVLNKGAAGVAEFAAAAKAAGFTTEETAKATEEFEQKVNVMKSTLIDGFGAQLISKLLPAMSSLIDSFNDSGRGAGALKVVAELLTGAFKIVGSLVLSVAGELTEIGKSIGAVAAAAVAAAHLNFKEAADIWKDNNAENLADAEATRRAIEDLWKEPLPKPPKVEVEKPEGSNLAEAEKQDAATVKLKEYSDALLVEAKTFGLGKAAMIEYDLQFGKLHQDVVDAKEKAGDLVKAIHANAAALQQKIDNKAIKDHTDALQEAVIKYGQSALAAEKYKNTTGELGLALNRMADGGAAARKVMDDAAKADVWQKDKDQLEDINRETNQLTGNLHQAAEAAFDFKNKSLTKDLTDMHDANGEAGLAQLAVLKEQALSQADFNQQVANAAKVTEDLKLVEDQTALAIQKGQTTELDGQAKIEEARKTTIAQLQQIHAAEVQISESGLGNPKEIEQAKQLQTAIMGIQKQTDLLTESVRNNLETSFADNFTKLIDGSEKFRKAITSMLTDVQKMMLQMIAKNYAQQLFGQAGPAGGLAGMLSKVVGGASGAGGATAGASSTAAAATMTTASTTQLTASTTMLTAATTMSTAAAAMSAAGASSAVSSAASGAGPGIAAATGGGGSGLFAGLFAAGGTIPMGSFGIVGESGPELAYTGSQNMNIAPLSAAGKKPVTVHNHFTVNAPGGTISRESQMQTAAAAARSLSQANRRNNQ